MGGDAAEAGRDRRSRLREAGRFWLMVLLLVVGCCLMVGAAAENPLIRVQDGDQPTADSDCTAADPAPTPTAVDVDQVPVSVSSTANDYFVLYAKHGDASSTFEFPVAVVRGEESTTDLTERIAALTADRYRVEKYAVSAPADVDGDCVDDLTELDDTVNHSPVNSAPKINFTDGATIIANPAVFNAIGGGIGIRFAVTDFDTSQPGIYFINTHTHKLHESFLFLDTINKAWNEVELGRLFYSPEAVAPDGSTGYFHFSLQKFDAPLNMVERVYSLLAANVHPVNNNLYFHIANFDLPSYQDQLDLFRSSRVDLIFDQHVYPPVNFTVMNQGEAYGRLRALDPDDRPHPRDIVVYDRLPNELSQAAGIITTTPQTPLAHVNLRAAQNGIPNAFVRQLRTEIDFSALIDNFVYYRVTESGWTLRAATPAEVEAHYAAQTPPTAQAPTRDLAVTAIRPLSRVGFADWTAFGVKAANVAVLGQLGFPAGTVPDGYAIPFYFYDEFMKANDLYSKVETMLADEDFQQDYDEQAKQLKEMRKQIKDATSPQWIIDALEAMHGNYPDGQSLRYRSSTNNEDLPSFNGAGLYDSYTQKPSETEEDGIDKSLKQVFASLWNFRAFSERELHNVDHLRTAMGVLVHPNYSDELANGVAVSFDPLHGRDNQYYVNTQLGEDLITNPPANSVPEETLIRTDGERDVLNVSNLIPSGQLLLSAEQTTQLARHLTAIHRRFKALYKPSPGEPFAMEIEFKITSENILAIKQARTWVFGPSQAAAGQQPGGTTPTPGSRPNQNQQSSSGGGGSGGSGGGGGGGSGGGGSGGGRSGGGSSVLIVANGWSPSDIGAAAALSSRTPDSAILYATVDVLSNTAIDVLDEYQPATVYLIGGKNVLNGELQRQIQHESPGSDIDRLAGSTRAHTAAAVARQSLGRPGTTDEIVLVIANGWSPSDIGAAAAYAARTPGSAVLYTAADALPSETADVIADYRPKKIVIIGGPAAVTEQTQAVMAAAAQQNTAIERISGTTRAHTAAVVARQSLGRPGTTNETVLVIANGWSPSDIGAAAAYAARTPDSAVLYTAADALPSETADVIADYRPKKIVIIGGPAAVTEQTQAVMAAAAQQNTAIERISGTTRAHTAAVVARQTLDE